MELRFKGKITNIHHDEINKKSKLYLNHGKEEIVIIRPMRKKYEWKRNKDEKIKSGDCVEVIIKKK